MKNVMAAAATTVMLCLSAHAFAQSSAVEKIVQTNRSTQAYRQAAEQNFRSYEVDLSSHCKDVQTDWTGSHARLVSQGKLLPDGKLSGTMWEEMVPSKACGEPRTYRVLVTLRDGQGGMQILLPGDGWAGPLLERDTRLQVAAAVAAYAHGNCATDVVNTHLDGGNPAANPKAVWTETWTVHSCGKHLAVPIRFTPDKVGDGTSMSVQASAIRQLP